MSDLNYMQRKALRRLDREQTISRNMRKDPVIRECYSTDPQPQLNSYGKKLLKELEVQE